MPLLRARHGLGVVDVALHPLRHPPVAPADEAHPDVLLVELVAPGEEEALVEAHEVAHLLGRSAPVLRGERVHREPAQPEVERSLHGVEQRRLARGVALGALQAPSRRPPPVAVHHARDVSGDAVGVDAGGEHVVEPTCRWVRSCRARPVAFPMAVARRDPPGDGALRGDRRRAAVGVDRHVVVPLALPVAPRRHRRAGVPVVGRRRLRRAVISDLGLEGARAEVVTDAIGSAEGSRQAATVGRPGRPPVVGPRARRRAADRRQRRVAGDRPRADRPARGPAMAARRRCAVRGDSSPRPAARVAPGLDGTAVGAGGPRPQQRAVRVDLPRARQPARRLAAPTSSVRCSPRSASRS